MFIARQPIFDKARNVYGYELLFRSKDKASSYQGTSAESSTAVVLGGLFELGLDRIVGSKRAFVNFDYNFLLSDAIELIDPSTLVIEVLENIPVDQKLLDRVAELRRAGYRIALDDFAENLKDYPVVPLADIIKYDILMTPLDDIVDEVRDALRQRKVLLAEKIETEEDFLKAKEMGFHLFQGYFFSKPVIVGGLKGRKTDVSVYRRILDEIHSEEPSFQTLTEIIGTDVNMAYRLMKAIHTKEAGDDQKDIKTALTRMGFLELERWIHILMLQNLSSNKPQELIRMSLIRSRMGEMIAKNSHFRRRRYEIALMCLFSVLDAMLDMPMEEAMEDVAVSGDVKKALVEGKGPLVPILRIASSYEQGDWDTINDMVMELGISAEKMNVWYLGSIQWAERVMRNN